MGSNEHYLEPRSKLREAAKDKGYSADEIFTLNHGGSCKLARGKHPIDDMTMEEKELNSHNDETEEINPKDFIQQEDIALKA
uniref:Uncharacterized protein n=1 Tax=Ditylenchus dipsaci TaxID=166011 RepID=A0A915DFV9_9BILA